MRKHFASPSPFLLLLLSMLSALPAAATLVVTVPDESLVDQATAVVEARIESREPSPAAGMPKTDYMVSIERVVKGQVPGSTLVVRVPGGMGVNGYGLKIYGAPEFRPGDRVLLFLKPSHDGTFHILHLFQGAFHEVTAGGQLLAVQSPAEVTRVKLPGSAVVPTGPRNLERFARWIEDRGQGNERRADYFVQLPQAEVDSITSRFMLFQGDDGNALRWFDFDSGKSVTWRTNESGQEGLTQQQTQAAAKAGVNAWDNVDCTNIRYTYGGTTPATTGLTTNDGVNSLLFGDPNGEIQDTFSCTSGGTLAIGGPFFFSSTRRGPDGKQYHEIVEGDIVTNKGLGCFFNTSMNKAAAAAELFGHELGHTLGLAHSSENPGESNALLTDALMYFALHDDGRGARLNADDVAAAQSLYGICSGGKPAAPSGLAGEPLSGTQVRLTWTDNATGEASYRVEQAPPGGSFQEVLILPPDTQTVIVDGLMPATSYRFRVRARGGAGFSAYSNEVEVTTQGGLEAPSGVTAEVLSGTAVNLAWTDESTNEVGYLVERSSPSASFEEIVSLPPDAEGFTVTGLTPGTPYTFRVRAQGLSGFSPYSEEASATTKGNGGPCVAGDGTLCVLNSRFRVMVQWRNQFDSGHNGIGHAVPVPGSDVTGRFWFFGPENFELIVKVIDGRPINGNIWFFYGSLSNVEYWITVEDTEKDRSRTYHSPPDQLTSLADTTAFPDPPAGEEPAVAAAKLAPAPPASLMLNPAPVADETTGSCAPGPATLCLQNGRIRVQVAWDNTQRQAGSLGVGQVRQDLGSNETGFFWFFSSDNVELAVKVLDGRALTGAFWLFAGGLSDVEYTITVTDTLTGMSRSFVKPFGELTSLADVNALPAGM